MKEEKEHIQYLLLRYLENKATEAERRELARFLKEGQDDNLWEEMMEEIFLTQPEMKDYREEEWQPLLDALLPRHEQARPKGLFRRIFRSYAAAAAALILLAGIGVYWWYVSNRHTEVSSQSIAVGQDVPAPAFNRATITMGDGSVVFLDSAANGQLALQGSTKLVKLANGKVSYENNDVHTGEENIIYNTLTNPRGSKVVSITLSDGTRVWLNAESSLKFPVSFSDNGHTNSLRERKVELIGEGYFEVAHDASKPFIVVLPSSSGGGREDAVQVLGTHFNVNAYPDEKERMVTLLEGSVRVTSPLGGGREGAETLKPGDQGIIRPSEISIQHDADLEQAIAWKNGYFSFHDADMHDVMRQLARWYDIDVEFRGAVPDRRFEGEIQRDLMLSQALKILETIKVNFKIEDKKIIVMP